MRGTAIITVERQNTFGWPVAVDVFLGGAGGGIFFISFLLELLNKYESLARIGVIVGPVLVMAGTIILFADLGAKRRMYRLLYNKSSWMTRGSWFIMTFILFSAAYLLPALWFSPWEATVLGRALGGIAATLAILVTIYPGFLFGIIKRIPFWNRTALPLLFLSSSLCSGIAILLLMGPFFIAGLGDGLYTLVIVAISLMILHLLLVVVFLEVASNVGTSAAESVRLLKRPLFIVTVIVTGLLIPLVLLWYHTVVSSTFIIPILAGILLLSGNLIFRHRILTAGVRIPLYPL